MAFLPVFCSSDAGREKKVPWREKAAY